MKVEGEEVLKACVKEGVVVERAEQTQGSEEHVMVAELAEEDHILRVSGMREEAWGVSFQLEGVVLASLQYSALKLSKPVMKAEDCPSATIWRDLVVASIQESVELLLAALVLLHGVVLEPTPSSSLDLRDMGSCSLLPYSLRQPCAILAFLRRIVLPTEGPRPLWTSSRLNHLFLECRCCFYLWLPERAARGQMVVQEAFPCLESAVLLQSVVHSVRLRLFQL